MHDLAERQQADVLVVGSTRHALLGRVLMGDDCRAALDGAPCALAIAPRGYSLVPPCLERVGVGYDGSPKSEHALSAAHDLARATRAAVTVLWVVSLQDVGREELVKLGTDVDLLIIGSCDHGRIGRLVHGSVSRYLVGHATCPLLVLPTGTAAVGATPGAEREGKPVAVDG